MKGYLLDTNVVSELRRPRPDANVVAWLKNSDPDELHLVTLTVGELRRGASKLGNTRKAIAITAWIDALVTVQFANRILAFDLRSAERWGRMMGEHDRQGQPLPPADSQIAAIAIEHGLVTVTRNVRDFRRMTTDVVNPFDPAP